MRRGDWKRGGKGSYGRGRGSGAGYSFFGNNPMAPSSQGSPQESKRELTKVPAVSERDHFHYDFLRAYPDQTLNCIKDYGKGPARLAPAEVNKFTTSLNSEWKRRLEFATSFTAASMRSLKALVQTLPDGLADILVHDDQNSILRTLVFVRELFLESQDGMQFMISCEHLDTNNDVQRNEAELSAHGRAGPLAVAAVGTVGL